MLIYALLFTLIFSFFLKKKILLYQQDSTTKTHSFHISFISRLKNLLVSTSIGILKVFNCLRVGSQPAKINQPISSQQVGRPEQHQIPAKELQPLKPIHYSCTGHSSPTASVLHLHGALIEAASSPSLGIGHLYAPITFLFYNYYTCCFAATTTTITTSTSLLL